MTLGKVGWATFCRFSAYRTGATSPTGKIAFNTEFYDIGNVFDTTNNRFIAPVAGYYTFSANIFYTAAASSNNGYGLEFRKNGSLLVSGVKEVKSYASSIVWGGSASVDVKLAQNDYIEVFAYNTNTDPLVVGATGSIFSGRILALDI